VLRVVTYAVDGWGIGELALLDDRPVSHETPRPTTVAGSQHVEDALQLERAPNDALSRMLTRIYAFFGGERVSWTADELQLGESADEWGFSPFMTRAAHALIDVPYGETVSYGDLALLAGRPRAARAAGGFCARNPLGLFIPCHRVISGDGSSGPYGSYGVDYKRRLLALEGHTRW
jgi:methylated-DNA-[protein]-cysteine S-methyltransferase